MIRGKKPVWRWSKKSLHPQRQAFHHRFEPFSTHLRPSASRLAPVQSGANGPRMEAAKSRFSTGVASDGSLSPMHNPSFRFSLNPALCIFSGGEMIDAGLGAVRPGDENAVFHSVRDDRNDRPCHAALPNRCGRVCAEVLKGRFIRSRWRRLRRFSPLRQFRSSASRRLSKEH
jgi:hypothetical protein